MYIFGESVFLKANLVKGYIFGIPKLSLMQYSYIPDFGALNLDELSILLKYCFSKVLLKKSCSLRIVTKRSPLLPFLTERQLRGPNRAATSSTASSSPSNAASWLWSHLAVNFWTDRSASSITSYWTVRFKAFQSANRHLYLTVFKITSR